MQNELRIQVIGQQLNIGNKLCVVADINMAIRGRYQYGNNNVVADTNMAICGSRYQLIL